MHKTKKMKCPYCNSADTKVVDSRESKDATSIKRRRECMVCTKRFSTLENVMKLDLEVKKFNGEIEEFKLGKIRKSLLKACEKRPITLEQIEEIITKALSDIKKFNEQTIPTTIIGNLVLKNLKEYDEISFLKYAIVHNNYTSMTEFIEEIEKLKNFSGLSYRELKELSVDNVEKNQNNLEN